MGLLCRAGTFRLFATGTGQFRPEWSANIMQKRNLEDSIRTLKCLRDTYHSQLDICAITELNIVITHLEEVSGQAKLEHRQKACLRALQAMADIIRLVSNIQDLM
jgi:hypothetical protein